MRRLIAEFEPQSYTQVIFPHQDTDWAEYLTEAQETFVNIINTIKKYQQCVVICDDIIQVRKYFVDDKNIVFKQYKTDDTWARDCSAISVFNDGVLELLDFTFNGWGNKFEATKDNLLTRHINKEAIRCDFVLEGGGIDGNGKDLLLTTTHTMFNPNRNKNLTKEQITQKLQEYFGVKHILYLHNGYLAGDDTDSHIDTLARFVDRDKIVYVQCQDKNDEHFDALAKMEEELLMYAKQYNLKLFPLPMVPPIYYDNERLPATYANFLFVNGAILVPTYNVKEDKIALEIFQKLFPTREVVGVDSLVLIRQHGSLHCVTMNFAKG